MNKNILMLIVVLAAFCVVSVSGQDSLVNHPVMCYKQIRRCASCPIYDSLLVGKITYDPMPRYQQESIMNIEFYCNFDSDRDVLLRVDGEWWWTYWISEYVHTWPGPVRQGDTLRAQFRIKPLQVGGVRPGFVAIEQMRYAFPASDSVAELQIPRARLRAHFMLAPDGTVLGMNSVATNQPYETFLGPLPEIMAESLIFWRDPKTPEFLINIRDTLRTVYKYFSIKTILYTQPNDSGYRRVQCEITPYHTFDEGCQMEFSHSGGIEYTRWTPDYSGIIKPSDTLMFALDFVIREFGISRLSFRFHTKNPWAGGYKNPVGHGDENLATSFSIFIGIDKDNGLIFISDTDPVSYIDDYSRAGQKRVSQRLILQREIDPRIKWVETSLATMD